MTDLSYNAELIEELSTRLAESLFDTIKILGNIVSLQDHYHDGSHSRFVSQKSVEIAEKLELPETDIFEIKVAGMLHDIGKIGFRDNLNVKFTSEMTESDYVVYKSHAEGGWELLRRYNGLEGIAEIVYQHHEMLDGSGFPRKLKGKQILPGAAIIAVVNTFHNSMFKLRKNKNIHGSNVEFGSTASFLEQTQIRYITAMNYLHSKTETWFDRKIVDTFFEIIEKERGALGQKVLVKIPVSKIEPGMIIYDDYYTSYGLLIAAKGETVDNDMVKALRRFAEFDQLPVKLLVIK